MTAPPWVESLSYNRVGSNILLPFHRRVVVVDLHNWCGSLHVFYMIVITSNKAWSNEFYKQMIAIDNFAYILGNMFQGN